MKAIKNEHVLRFKISSFIVLLLPVVLLMLHAGCKKDEPNFNNQNNVNTTTLPGNWKITGTLVTTTNPDPNAPAPGFQAMENWQISVNNGVPALTSPKGTVNGTFTGSGHHYEGQVDVYPGLVWCNFTIEVFPSVEYNKLYGTEEFKYYGLNGVGQPMFLGTESWTLAGEKI